VVAAGSIAARHEPVQPVFAFNRRLTACYPPVMRAGNRRAWPPVTLAGGCNFDYRRARRPSDPEPRL